MKRKRDIITIDGAKCDGCGLCVTGCPEGALQVIDGKARLVSDKLCDGLGACIGECPRGAIRIERREAAEYDERKAMELAMEKEQKLAAHLRELAAKIANPQVKAVFEQNARSTDHHYQLIESEYARLMGMVHETDIDTFVRE